MMRRCALAVRTILMIFMSGLLTLQVSVDGPPWSVHLLVHNMAFRRGKGRKASHRHHSGGKIPLSIDKLRRVREVIAPSAFSP